MAAMDADQAVTAGAGPFDAAALREQVAGDGFAVVRGAVPAADVAALRAALVEVLAGAGLVRDEDAGGEVAPVDAAVPVDVHGDAPLFARLYSLEALHLLPHHPRLLALAGALLEPSGGVGGLLVHPRPALRVVFPATPEAVAATPPHQDLLGMQGTPDAYTVWTAVSPCPRATGVLAVAAGSHRAGLRPYLAYPGARVAGCGAADLEGRWSAVDLAPGDAVVFHSLAVHRALPNRSHHVRLSVDARYQRATDPVCAATLAERADLPWSEIYAGWSERGAPYRRYWERLALRPVALDASLFAAPAGAGSGAAAGADDAAATRSDR